MPPTPDRLPDYHFLLIPPSLGAEWFFDAARAYWERFRPIVVSDIELVRFIPLNYAIIITLLARRDLAAQWGVTIAQQLPHVYFDPVVQDQFDALRLALTNRVGLGQPFGVPLLPTPTPAPQLQVTPGPVVAGTLPPVPTLPPTRAPAGFITEVPQIPFNPTPGPITGGGG